MADHSEQKQATTLILLNVPTYFTQGSLLSMFEDLHPAMRDSFDFFHCPWDDKEVRNVGYSIINFSSREGALDFQQEWNNKELCEGRREKRLRVTKALIQGLQNNLDYFSRVRVTECEDVRFRPLYRGKDGCMHPLELAADAKVETVAIPGTSLRQRPVVAASSLAAVVTGAPAHKEEAHAPRGGGRFRTRTGRGRSAARSRGEGAMVHRVEGLTAERKVPFCATMPMRVEGLQLYPYAGSRSR